RRGHDLMKPPRSEFISVPLILRLGLGVYLFVLAIILGRGYLQRQQGPTAIGWRRFVLPTILAATGAVLVATLLQPRRNPERPAEDFLPVRSVPAAELSGLGYLPDDVNIVAGLHVAEVLQNPDGRALWSGLLHLGPVDLGPERLGSLVQLKPEEIDHVVV